MKYEEMMHSAACRKVDDILSKDLFDMNLVL
jgi:hypothetical protein